MFPTETPSLLVYYRYPNLNFLRYFTLYRTVSDDLGVFITVPYYIVEEDKPKMKSKLSGKYLGTGTSALCKETRVPITVLQKNLNPKILLGCVVYFIYSFMCRFL